MLIISAIRWGFEKEIKNLTAVIPYSDAIELQFGNKMITIMLPQVELFAMILKMI